LIIGTLPASKITFPVRHCGTIAAPPGSASVAVRSHPGDPPQVGTTRRRAVPVTRTGSVSAP